MAGHSRPDIIKEHPVGRGLDAFRDAFSLTCEELGYAVSSDALQHYSNQGEVVQQSLNGLC